DSALTRCAWICHVQLNVRSKGGRCRRGHGDCESAPLRPWGSCSQRSDLGLALHRPRPQRARQMRFFSGPSSPPLTESRQISSATRWLFPAQPQWWEPPSPPTVLPMFLSGRGRSGRSKPRFLLLPAPRSSASPSPYLVRPSSSVHTAQTPRLVPP